jgi:hypothetical protein
MSARIATAPRHREDIGAAEAALGARDTRRVPQNVVWA